MNYDKVVKILIVMLVFLVGFMSAYFVNYYSTGFTYFNGSVRAPSDFVDNKNILVYPDKVIIELEGARVSSYAPTGSMVPVLDVGANGISVKPHSEEEIQVGDIISFWREGDLIVHRVVEKETDEQGIYFVTKGDNSFVSDGKVRFGDVEHRLIGLIY